MKRLIYSFFFLTKKRPQQVVARALEFAKFQWTRLLCRLFVSAKNGIELGTNVRLQKFSSLMAERPSGRIRIGANSVIYENAAIEAYGSSIVSLGESCVIGDMRIYSRESVTLGARVLTSWNVLIQDYDPHPISAPLRAAQVELLTLRFQPSFARANKSRESELELALKDWKPISKAIAIGDDVWIGASCTILKGAQIGSGSVVAAGSVVTAGFYPEGSLIAGNPARVIRSLLP